MVDDKLIQLEDFILVDIMYNKITELIKKESKSPYKMKLHVK